MFFTSLGFKHMPGIALLAFLLVPCVRGNPEHEEQKATIAALELRIKELEAATIDAEKQVTGLSQSLAVANEEAVEYRELYDKLRSQSEALGLAVLQGQGGLQERLLSALNDLRRLEGENQGLRKLIDSLYGTARRYLENSVPSEDSVGSEMQTALTAVEKHYQTEAEGRNFGAADVESAKVIGIKQELGLVVLNVGRDKGIRPGMPIQIVRVDKPIVPALVVDVRDKLSGAVCQAPAETFRQVRLGDGIRIELTP
jgi:hypothetical protein